MARTMVPGAHIFGSTQMSINSAYACFLTLIHESPCSVPAIMVRSQIAEQLADIASFIAD